MSKEENSMKPSYFCEFVSPIGLMFAEANEDGLLRLGFSDKQSPSASAKLNPGFALLQTCQKQLAEYYQGSRREFDLPLAAPGTDFQLQAWKALQTIPYGQTRSYAEQAASIGKATAVRAIGAANGRNPISIVVPCHRVMGKNGALTGYAGGVERKDWLIKHELSVLGVQPVSI